MESCSPNSSSPILQQREEESMSSISRRIPEDVYHEILLRLPVKSIKNCKYVCKSWFSIISNPNFVNLHLQRSKNNPSSDSLLLGFVDHMNPISYDSLKSSLSIKEIEDRAVSLRMLCPPLKPVIDSVRLFGSCNGLLFLWFYVDFEAETDGSYLSDDEYEYLHPDGDYHLQDDEDYHLQDDEDYHFEAETDGSLPSDDEYLHPDIDGSPPDDDDYQNPNTDGSPTYDFDDFKSDNKYQFLYVWNPATDEYKEIIPPSPHINIRNQVCITGLGYDGKNDDYKFVIGVCSRENGLATLLKIFSLRSNSWQTIETPYGFTYDEFWCSKPGELVNGDLHWLAKGDCGLCIVYLDFHDDTPSFKEIQLPTVPNLDFDSVGVLEEGCLCVVGHDRDPVSLGRVQVWEMKVYGVRESWTKRYTIANDTISKSVMAKYSGRKPIWSFKNGKIVFLDPGDVVLYDPKHGNTVERELETLAYFESGANYVESLVSVGSGTYAGTERMKESKKRKANDNVIFSCFGIK